MKNQKTTRSKSYDLSDHDVANYTTVDPRVTYGKKRNVEQNDSDVESRKEFVKKMLEKR